MSFTPLGPRAQMIHQNKYALVPFEGESWTDTAWRVANAVMKPVFPELTGDIARAIESRKFMPGGRYFYASGRPRKMYNNCLLLNVQDSKEGWGDLYRRATIALCCGAGIGVVYSGIRGDGAPVGGMGGKATGPMTPMRAVDQIGSGIMQGGSRRAAIWAGLHWNHPDVMTFINSKTYPQVLKDAKAWAWENNRAQDIYQPLENTNISVILDDAFFEAYYRNDALAHEVYDTVVGSMLTTGEPGFSIDTGQNAGEHLRNACVPGDTEILTIDGYRRIDSVVDTVVEVWNGQDWSKVTPSVTGTNRDLVRVTFDDGRELVCTPNHKFYIQNEYGTDPVAVHADELVTGDKLERSEFPVIYEGQDIEWAYTQGFISAEGTDDYNYFWVYSPKYMCLSRMSLRGLSQEYEDRNSRMARPSFAQLPKSFVPFDWSVKSRLDWLAGLFDGDGTVTRDGNIQVSNINKQFLLDVQRMLTALGTNSKVTKMHDGGPRMMPDGRGGLAEYVTQPCYRLSLGSSALQFLVNLGLRCERISTNFSPNRNATRFAKVVSVEPAGNADVVYCFTEPERGRGVFNGILTGQCTEVTSSDDNDICNLGSIVLPRVESLEEMKNLTELGTAFLIAGSITSDVPYAEVADTRTKNRRLGLGIMGFAEWLAVRGYRYAPNDELEGYLLNYAHTSNWAARLYAERANVSTPVKTRAIAPTGTIGMLAETTTGIEPVYATAYLRRYVGQDKQVITVDESAKRMIEQGASPDNIESAMTLAHDPARRLDFQAFVQQYVDHGISSTLNLPSVEEQPFSNEEFGKILIDRLPHLRGMTVYPDGARGAGQPLTPFPLEDALKMDGLEYDDNSDQACASGVCGI